MKSELNELKSIVAEVIELLEFDSSIEKNKIEKSAYNLFSMGDEIVCTNEVEGLIKGQKYRIIEKPKPGYITVQDVFGNEIGMFKADRFVLNNNEY